MGPPRTAVTAASRTGKLRRIHGATLGKFRRAPKTLSAHSGGSHSLHGQPPDASSHPRAEPIATFSMPPCSTPARVEAPAVCADAAQLLRPGHSRPCRRLRAPAPLTRGRWANTAKQGAPGAGWPSLQRQRPSHKIARRPKHFGTEACPIWRVAACASRPPPPSSSACRARPRPRQDRYVRSAAVVAVVTLQRHIVVNLPRGEFSNIA